MRLLIAVLLFVSPFVRAYTISGNTYRTNGSQSDVASAVSMAGDGMTVTLPDGSYTWSTSSPVKIRTAIILRAENVPTWPNASKVNITNSGGTGAYPLEITPSANGNVTLAGLNFNNTDTSGKQSLFWINGTAKPVLMRDCTFTVGNFVLLHTINWTSGNGVIWHCTFSMKGLSNGTSTSGGIYQEKGNLGWWEKDTFGNVDSNGDKNFYIEDCVFNNFWNQGIDIGDNGRAVIRHNTFNNTQCLTHGVTGHEGGRAVEYYDNTCVYYPINSNGDQLPDSGGQTVPGGFWAAMQRWFWWRAGTARVHHNNIQVIYSYGYFGSPPPCWAFCNESLTRTGAMQTTCQRNSDYIGFHWCGSGGNGNGSNPWDYRTYITLDPVYIWANTYNRGYSDNDSQIAKIDQQDCPPVQGVNKTSDVFLKDRDYYIGSTAAPNYTPYTYPHPLRGGGGGPGPTPTPTPGPPIPTPTPSSTPTPAPGAGVTITSTSSTTSTVTLGFSYMPVINGWWRINYGTSFNSLPDSYDHSPVGTPSSGIVTGLSAGTVYYFQVTYFPDGGQPSSSSVVSETTAGGIAPTPTPPDPKPSPTPGAATYNQWIQKQNDWTKANPPTPD